MSHISLSEIKEIYNMYITVTPIQNLLEQTALSQTTNLAERYQCNQQILKFHNIRKDSCVIYIVVLSLIGRIFLIGLLGQILFKLFLHHLGILLIKHKACQCLKDCFIMSINYY